MNIVFCISENYLIFLETAIASILANAASNDEFNFIIFSEWISNNAKNNIENLQKIKNFKITYIDVDLEKELPDFKTTDIWTSKLCYLRIKVPLILSNLGFEYERILYLDADIIVHQSLTELYNMSLDKYAIGAVASPITDEELHHFNELALNKKHNYFYSGLLLFDTKKYIENQYYEKACAISINQEKGFYWPDMDLLNLIFQINNYKKLKPKFSINPLFNHEPLTYNLQTYFKIYNGIYSNEDIKEAFYKPIIWQLAGGAKPNSRSSNLKTVLKFYKYAKLTSFQNIALKFLIKKLFKFIIRKDVFCMDGYKIKQIKIFDKIIKQKIKILPNPSIELNSLRGGGVLVCPHPDDEIIGAGGLLIKYSGKLDVACLSSSGVKYNGQSAKERSDIRIKEFYSVMEALNVKNYWIFETFGEQPPFINQIDNHFKDYLKVIDFSKYDYIFLPQPRDSHPEHSYITNNLIKRLMQYSKPKPTAKVVFYEVWQSISEPNYYLNIDDYMEKKLQILKMYSSQIDETWNYPRWVKGLNTYRSMNMPPAKYAEAYYICSLKDYLRGEYGYYKKIKK